MSFTQGRSSVILNAALHLLLPFVTTQGHSNVFILKGYLFMGLYNPYSIRKIQGLWVCIILIGLGKPKVCVNLFGIGEPIKLLFKGCGKRKT